MNENAQNPTTPTPEVKSETRRGYIPPNEQESRWFFDYTMTYLELKAQLSGGLLVRDYTGFKIIDAHFPFGNETMVQESIAVVNGFSSKITALSYYDNDDRIFEECLDIALKLDSFYFVNMERFEMSPETASIVKKIIMHTIESNMRISIQGRSGRLVGESEQVSIQRIEQPRSKLFGIF